MTRKLIIVESPAKARTISNILDADFIVLSSVGHIRDLPKTRFGVNVQKNFDPEYVPINGKQKVIDKIRKAARDVDEIYLAADPDREGEAICWHISHYLEEFEKPIFRVLYYEITRNAILKSLTSPGRMDLDKINAQQARRILDRIVGYRLSPLLWKKVRRGLSAGRVQSVALKIICDREREIRAFVAQEYWLLNAHLKSTTPPSFDAVFHGTDGKKRKLVDRETTETIQREIESHPFTLGDIAKRKVTRNPLPPFITSTLQQESSRQLRFQAQKTMSLAQGLYEGKEVGSHDQHGLITYMRTDSPRISDEAQIAARSFIESRFGASFLPLKPPVYKAKKSAQGAHEAIRPTSVDLTPEKARPFLTPDELKLYTLIWNRFVASQMASAVLNVTTLKIKAGQAGRHEFRAVGTEIEFRGFLEFMDQASAVKKKATDDPDKDTDTDDADSQVLPTLKLDALLDCEKIEASQHFTKPPARFTEATLVKELETQGIGRPSTYATILTTIRDQEYVEITDRRFFPTDLGMLVIELLSEQFPEIMSISFTAELEDQLDHVEEGTIDWTTVVRNFYVPFEARLKTAESISKAALIPTIEGFVCPDCGGVMQLRWGKKGRFLSCAKFPECKGILPYSNREKPESGSQLNAGIPTPGKCTECGSATVIKRGKFGFFLSCSRYPECKAKGPKPDGLPCPVENCTGTLTPRHGKSRRIFHGCSRYPDCNYTFSGILIPASCTHCHYPNLTATVRKDKITIQCPRCNFESPVNDEQVSIDGTGNPEVSDIS